LSHDFRAGQEERDQFYQGWIRMYEKKISLLMDDIYLLVAIVAMRTLWGHLGIQPFLQSLHCYPDFDRTARFQHHSMATYWHYISVPSCRTWSDMDETQVGDAIPQSAPVLMPVHTAYSPGSSQPPSASRFGAQLNPQSAPANSYRFQGNTVGTADPAQCVTGSTQPGNGWTDTTADMANQQSQTTPFTHHHPANIPLDTNIMARQMSQTTSPTYYQPVNATPAANNIANQTVPFRHITYYPMADGQAGPDGALE
jgi:hypothetical protein